MIFLFRENQTHSSIAPFQRRIDHDQVAHYKFIFVYSGSFCVDGKCI